MADTSKKMKFAERIERVKELGKILRPEISKDSTFSGVIESTGSVSFRSSIFIGILSSLQGLYAGVPQDKRPYDFVRNVPGRDEWSRNAVVTLEDLGLHWSADSKNQNKDLQKSKLGVSWEYAIKYGIDADNTLSTERPVLRERLNQAIAECPPFSDSDKSHKAILWGGEKVEDIFGAAKQTFREDETIWTPGGGRPVKIENHLKAARDGVIPYNIEARESLPESAREIWKADLFIKRQGTDTWFGVSAKHKPERFDDENHRGLSIGISRYNPSKETGLPDPYWNENQKMARVQIPYEFEFGEGFQTGYNIVTKCLESLSTDTDKASREIFPNTFQRKVANLLFESRKLPVPRILSKLRRWTIRSNLDPSELNRDNIRIVGDSEDLIQPVPRILPPDELN